MKDDNKNKEFIERNRKLDFSIESTHQEENLERLKTKLLDVEKERGITMNKKIKKPIAVVAAATAIMCFSVAVYGQDLIRIIKTVTLGNHAQYEVIEDLKDFVTLPENLVGQIFDKKGNALSVYPADTEALYNADGQEVIIYYDSDTEKAAILTMKEYEELQNYKMTDFYDMEEGRGYFICETFMPTYLPEGYFFEKISFYAGSKEEISADQGANKYMSVYYSNGKEEIYSQVRFMDEETGFGSSATKDIQKIEINGHEAVIDGNNLDIQIGDVMYMFMANENLSQDELIKIAESLK